MVGKSKFEHSVDKLRSVLVRLLKTENLNLLIHQSDTNFQLKREELSVLIWEFHNFLFTVCLSHSLFLMHLAIVAYQFHQLVIGRI